MGEVSRTPVDPAFDAWRASMAEQAGDTVDWADTTLRANSNTGPSTDNGSSTGNESSRSVDDWGIQPGPDLAMYDPTKDPESSQYAPGEA